MIADCGDSLFGNMCFKPDCRSYDKSVGDGCGVGNRSVVTIDFSEDVLIHDLTQDDDDDAVGVQVQVIRHLCSYKLHNVLLTLLDYV